MKHLNRKTSKETKIYPERIIQFGEGNFLRAFADWIIAAMNREAGFNSGVVVVQPLPEGLIDTLNEQDGLYHVNLQGYNKGTQIDSIELIDCITRGINPYRNYGDYLALADNPDMRFVISNTTEAGIVFDDTCKLEDEPANSYPGKLTQLLYRRFKTFGAAKDKGLIIFPCELIFHNGRELKKCIKQYIQLWNLGDEFNKWFEQSCGVYSTLVDRIVPGFPKETINEIENRIQIKDKLVTMAEAFHLWVIEAPENIRNEFPADAAGLNVLFVSDEEPYHERKVKLLNAPHTVLSPVGYLSGLDTVKQCMDDETIGRYINGVMYSELMQTIDLPRNELLDFAKDVADRFRNPYIKHYLTSIMLNSFSKYRTRVLPSVKLYREKHNKLPQGLILGLAAIITYYKGGLRNEDKIVPQDNPSVIDLLSNLWRTEDIERVASGVLSSTYLWEENLNDIPGLTDKVTGFLRSIQQKGMRQTVTELYTDETK